MTRDELLALLRGLEGDNGDLEAAHVEADKALLTYINDPDISAAFEEIWKARKRA
jgi:hypothetical protein